MNFIWSVFGNFNPWSGFHHLPPFCPVVSLLPDYITARRPCLKPAAKVFSRPPKPMCRHTKRAALHHPFCPLAAYKISSQQCAGQNAPTLAGLFARNFNFTLFALLILRLRNNDIQHTVVKFGRCVVKPQIPRQSHRPFERPV